MEQPYHPLTAIPPDLGSQKGLVRIRYMHGHGLKRNSGWCQSQLLEDQMERPLMRPAALHGTALRDLGAAAQTRGSFAGSQCPLDGDDDGLVINLCVYACVSVCAARLTQCVYAVNLGARTNTYRTWRRMEWDLVVRWLFHPCRCLCPSVNSRQHGWLPCTRNSQTRRIWNWIGSHHHTVEAA